ncbi:DMT family transporter [Gorillibacterium timonense]|uniref:DMT family transporter n=1 Tax=Gorillibacterium timonense TaxID=1689269 RepID=UPI00071C55EB|nr:DMT family transporter [Gorillibacterium timonense]
MNKNVYTNGKFVAAVATLCCLLWGSAFPSVKLGLDWFQIGLEDIPSKFVFAGYRFMLAGAVLLAAAKVLGIRILRLAPKDWAGLTALGLFQTGVQYLFFYIGVAHTTGVKGSIMNATTTFFSVLLAHFLYKNDRLTPNKVGGCLLGFLGVVLVNFHTDLLDFSFRLNGEGFIIIAALVFSIAALYSKRLAGRIDVIVITGYSLLIGGVALTVTGLLGGGRVTHFTLSSAALLLYLALLSSVAFCLWNLLLKYNKVGQVSVYNFLIPVFGSLLSALFLGETILEMKNLIALLLVCGGIALVYRKSRGRKAIPAK